MTKKGKARKKTENKNKKGVILFVEGETDKVFYDKLTKFLIEKNSDKQPVNKIIIKNVKGIGKYNSKPMGYYKIEVLPKYRDFDFNILCCYDSDVFEQAGKPPVNWKKISHELKKLGAMNVEEVIAVRMIEDWFLIDIHGLCDYLGIQKISLSSLKGTNTLEKINNLFQKKNKIYTKGFYCESFINYLDFNLICSKIVHQVTLLEKYIFERSQP